MIRFENVSKSFKDGDKYHIILNRASTSFNDGQKNCIVGRSGLGKSTVLKLISSIFQLLPKKRFVAFVSI